MGTDASERKVGEQALISVEWEVLGMVGMALGHRTLPQPVTDHPSACPCFPADSLLLRQLWFAVQRVKVGRADENLRG